METTTKIIFKNILAEKLFETKFVCCRVFTSHTTIKQQTVQKKLYFPTDILLTHTKS